MGESYRLWTPEQIEVQFDIAGIGSRLIAAIVDQLILTFSAVVLFFGLAALGTVASSRSSGRSMDDAAIGLIFALLFVVWNGYFVFFEWVWSGQTPGKRLTGLRVIRDGGSPIGLAESAIRNIVRMVDFLPFYYVIGVVTMLLNRRSKRLGDLAAGTIVVKERRHVALDPLGGAVFPQFSADPATLPDVSALGNADFVLVRRYFQRADTLDPHERARLAAQVLRAIAPRLAWPPGEAHRDPMPELALRLVAQAYQARMRQADPAG